MTKWVCNLTWEDNPALTKEAKEELLASYLPYERDARTKGIPQLGSGAIYPICEEDIISPVFSIPDKWPRAYGMDVGWKKTAGIFGAYNPKEDCWYLYSEYYKGYAEPSIHADGIKARGFWLSGVIDPNSDRRSEAGGTELLTIYERLGLNLSKANNAVEPGLLEVYQRLSSGRLKIFPHLLNWLAEFRIYRKDKNGKIVKKNDHLMDATRYLIMSGQEVMDTPPPDDLEDLGTIHRPAPSGRNPICGY
jgi:hypothetical protein